MLKKIGVQAQTCRWLNKSYVINIILQSFHLIGANILFWQFCQYSLTLFPLARILSSIKISQTGNIAHEHLCACNSSMTVCLLHIALFASFPLCLGSMFVFRWSLESLLYTWEPLGWARNPFTGTWAKLASICVSHPSHPHYLTSQYLLGHVTPSL